MNTVKEHKLTEAREVGHGGGRYRCSEREASVFMVYNQDSKTNVDEHQKAEGIYFLYT